VARLLQEYGIQDLEKIKGTGIRGMLTKGDVLAFLGKASSPTGTFKQTQLSPGSEATQVAQTKVQKVRPIISLYSSIYSARIMNSLSHSMG
jgi:pyruvate/2-oxoglutarate dehydrogenase complex dihydrolipoamide acyltransferase (E2) component